MGRFALLGLIVLALAGCKRDHHAELIPREASPRSFPQMEYPQDNAYSPERWQLGKTLFFDKRFSDNNDVSCATCHQPDHYFADQTPTTDGTGNATGTRNVPSLVNVGYHPYFTREGGVSTLEKQVLIPIQEHNEFNSNILMIAEELNEDEELLNLSIEAYGEPISAFTITRALSNYERSLVGGYTRYDYFEEGYPGVFTAEEAQGRALFFGEAGCGGCHNGFDLTTYEIVNNGLYATFEDPGLYRLTLDPADSGKFKIPSLRNIEHTAPYMHDGSVQTLEEVIAHYVSGGASHTFQDQRIQPLSLSESEGDALIAFLKTLTDESFTEIHHE